MKRFVIIGCTLFAPLAAFAQSQQAGPQLTVTENRLALCTVSEARLQQDLADAQNTIKTLQAEIAKLKPATPPEIPKPPEKK